uniref:Uncharacterized protein n=1 Tax=Fervidicoccus fontis TaxID=683846 RepID=A0A7J3ZLE8_9CREN
MKDNCEKRLIDMLEFSECKEHPFTLLVKVLECASKHEGEYKVRVPAGTIPINILEDYAKRYGVSFWVTKEKEHRMPISIDVEVFHFKKPK